MDMNRTTNLSFALALTLLAVGGLVYVLVSRSLDDEINDSLREVSRQAAQVLQETAAPQAPARETDDDEHESEEEEEGEGEEDEDHEAEGEFDSVPSAGQLLGNTGNVFLLVLDSSGEITANPRGVAADRLPVAAALAAASNEGEGRQNGRVGDTELRMLTVGVADDAGETVRYVLTVKSLEERNADLRRLLVLLAIGGGVGIVLAGAGGLWVASLAIRPVRRAFERQREFVADASHELRTPLTVVRANAESLLRRASDEERVALDDIVAEAGHMGRLVSDLLALAQADRGGLELLRAPVDIADVVESVAKGMRGLAQEKEIELTAQAAHVTVWGDPDRLREMLLSLVDNAIRYTPAGGRVEIGVRQERAKVTVTVSDTGIGIEKEHVPRLFDRFYRVDKARSRSEGGLGLGLSIAQAIVQAHKGEITIESAPGRGTTVLVTLPVASGQDEPRQGQTEALAPDAPEGTRSGSSGKGG